MKLPIIGQGGMGIGGYFEKDSSKDDVFLDALEEGIRYGATLLDTAEGYGVGHSEELIGELCKKQREKLFISTKFSPEHSKYHDVLAAADRSLGRLKTDFIDLYQIHWPNNTVPIEETIAAMNDLVKAGKVRTIGVSNFSMKELKKAQQYARNKISFVQVEYNLFDRTIESELFPYCSKNNIIVLAYSPTDQGMLHLSELQKEILRNIGDKYRKSTFQVMLNWLTVSNKIIAIPKASKKNHAKENALSVDFVLSTGDLNLIDEYFPKGPVLIVPNKIQPVSSGEPGRKVYHTKQLALENPFRFVPSPTQLAKEMLLDSAIKPIRIKETAPGAYELMEGRIRYWAWIIAFGEDCPIPCLVKKAVVL
jgi:diketogulonate reductase-like aldo/keto reductase